MTEISPTPIVDELLEQLSAEKPTMRMVLSTPEAEALQVALMEKLKAGILTRKELEESLKSLPDKLGIDSEYQRIEVVRYLIINCALEFTEDLVDRLK